MAKQGTATLAKNVLLKTYGLRYNCTVNEVVFQMSRRNSVAVNGFLYMLKGTGFATSSFVADGKIGGEARLSLIQLFNAAEEE